MSTLQNPRAKIITEPTMAKLPICSTEPTIFGPVNYFELSKKKFVNWNAVFLNFLKIVFILNCL